MPNCSVFCCKKRSATSSLQKDGITFHIFPKHPELRKAWKFFCNNNRTWEPKRTSVVCSIHFLPSDFQVLANNRRRLVENSIPTLIPHCVCSSHLLPMSYKTVVANPQAIRSVTPNFVTTLGESSSLQKQSSDDIAVMPPRRVSDDNRSVTPITDPEDEEEKETFTPADQKDYTIVIQDPLSLTASGSFKQLHSHQPGADHSQLYVQPSTSTELVIKEEIDEEFLDYKTMYYKLLEEVNALKNQQLYKENQALIETNKSLGKEMENLIATNQKYINDMQQLMSENQKLAEKNQSLAENIQNLSDKIQELTEKNKESKTKERVNIFSDYIEKIENLNEKIRNLAEIQLLQNLSKNILKKVEASK